jgi:hypothetical protein
MTVSWPEFDRHAREISSLAESAGIPKARARALADELASRPLPAAQSARLLLLMARHDPTLMRRVLEADSRPGGDDPTIRAAHQLLTTLAPADAPDIDVIRLTACPTGENWFACHRDGTIYVDPSNPLFTAAEDGALLGLASLLLHEEHHRRHGGDEASAYDAQLRLLEQHDAQPDLIAQVRRSKAYALSHPTSI